MPPFRKVESRGHEERDDQDHEEPGHDERDKGQREDVKAQILVEEGVHLVEGLRVGEEEIVVPLARGVQPGHQTHHQGDRRVDTPGVGTNDVLISPHDLVFGVKGEIARAKTVGEEQIAPHDEEKDRPEGESQADLDEKEGGEDIGQGPPRRTTSRRSTSTATLRRERNPTRTMTTMIPIQNRRESRPRRRGRWGTSVELRTESSLRLI
jgi:hypothetical protein